MNVDPSKEIDINDRFLPSRRRMVSHQLARRDIKNDRVLAAMERVPRQRFVSENLHGQAYADGPLPIGHGQTISQPYIVALMTQLVDPKPEHRVLDVGTGSGYQAAVLGELVDRVFSLEIVEALATAADRRLKSLGYQNITVRHGDAHVGWESESPFDAIIVAAAPQRIPSTLVDQLARGGKMVIPVGDRMQTLILVEKQTDGTVVQREIAPVAFVPMTGRASG